jgi:hypothetical protein
MSFEHIYFCYSLRNNVNNYHSSGEIFAAVILEGEYLDNGKMLLKDSGVFIFTGPTS